MWAESKNENGFPGITKADLLAINRSTLSSLCARPWISWKLTREDAVSAYSGLYISRERLGLRLNRILHCSIDKGVRDGEDRTYVSTYDTIKTGAKGSTRQGGGSGKKKSLSVHVHSDTQMSKLVSSNQWILDSKHFQDELNEFLDLSDRGIRISRQSLWT